MVGRLHLLLLVFLASAASAETVCPIDEEPAGDLEHEMESLIDPACRNQADKIVLRMEASIAMNVASGEMDAEDAAGARSMLEFYRIRGLLARRDVALARERLVQLLHQPGGEFVELRADEIEPIVAVLEGRVDPPSTFGPISAGPDWIPVFGWCGTSRAMYEYFARVDPSEADAWYARGRVDYAVSSLLTSEWKRALGLGLAPPQLVDCVDLMLGPGSYRREIEIALKGIRLEKRVDGMYATLPVFGHTLPLPVGWEGQDGKVHFETTAEVAEFVRPMLLGRDEE